MATNVIAADGSETITGSPYTAAQTEAINSARAANVANGVSAYSGQGATTGSIANGNTAAGTGTPLFAAPSTINSSNTSPATSIQLPPPPTASNTGSQAITALTGTAAATPVTTPTTSTTTPTTDTTDPATAAFQSYLSGLQAPPNTADIYEQDENNAGISGLQSQVNTYQAQLTAITNNAAAEKLSLTGQGTGVPNAIIGGQQAEIDKEAAIQALPISAQLAAAQGNLTEAQNNVDTLFKIQSEDAQNQVTYQNSLVTAVYNFATSEQKAQLDAMTTANNQAFTESQTNLEYAHSLSTLAIQNQQPALAAQIMALDPTDPNYAANLSTFASGIQVEKAPTASETSAATTAQIGTDLADSSTYLTDNPGNVQQAQQAFLAAHPDGLAQWNAYWGVTTANPDGNYPSAPASSSPGIISDVVNWFKSL